MLKNIPFYASLLGRPIAANKKSTTGHVLVYGAIEVHSIGPKGCIATNATIARETGLSASTIPNLISQLAKAGWIGVELSAKHQRTGIKPLLEIVNPSSGNEGGVSSQTNPFKEYIKVNNPTEYADASADTSIVIDGTEERSDDKQDIPRLTNELENDAIAGPTVLKLFYDVIRFYDGLPVRNHNHVKAKAKALEDEIGFDHACLYLRAMLTYDLRTMEDDFKPTLNEALDIYSKRVKILDFYKRHTGSGKKYWRPEDYEAPKPHGGV